MTKIMYTSKLNCECQTQFMNVRSWLVLKISKVIPPSHFLRGLQNIVFTIYFHISHITITLYYMIRTYRKAKAAKSCHGIAYKDTKSFADRYKLPLPEFPRHSLIKRSFRVTRA